MNYGHKHRPRPGWSKERVWMHCVTPELCALYPHGKVAHGNIVREDVCSCGATRLVEINGGHKNFARWQGPVTQ